MRLKGALAVILAVSMLSTAYANVFAQSAPPLPAPSQDDSSIVTRISKMVNDILDRAPYPISELGQKKGQNSEAESEKDTTKPIIEITTKELVEGKNVIFVRITDESALDSRFVKYVSNGKIVYGDLVKSEGDQYKSLVDVKGPKSILIFQATDEFGNKAIVKKEFTVKPSESNWLNRATNWFQNLLPT